MEHVLTQNGRSYTCLCCHRVLESQADYDRVSCGVTAYSNETTRQRDANSNAPEASDP